MTDTFAVPLPADIRALATEAMREACRQQRRLAVAESCTGGLLAALITDIEGCSHAFDRGFVPYTDQAKEDLLGVPAVLISTFGVVSVEVAEAMAHGALRASEANLALSITGFAGEAGPGEEPGLVCFGLAVEGKPTVSETHHFRDSDRTGVRQDCLRTALKMLNAALAKAH